MSPSEYLKNHSLNEEFVTKQLGWVLQEDQIIIPVYGDDRKLLYCKYRHLVGDTKFTFDKGGHPALYCLHKVLDLDKVVLAEGEPDVARLWQEGIPAVTATSGVKTFNSSLADKLKDKLVYICLDTDAAGQDEVEKYAKVLTASGAKPLIVTLPSMFKDVSVYFTDGGTKETFEKLMDEAVTYEQWEVEHRPEEWKLENGKDLMSRELPPDEWLIDRIIPAEGFTFIVGAEATGKSFYTLSLANSLVTGKPWLDKFEVNKKVNVLFIDKENSPRRKQARIAGLGMKEGIENIHWVMYPQNFQLSDPKEDDGLSKFAKMLSKEVNRLNIGLIILDSFADLMVGNENSAADVQQFFDAIRILFPDKSILVLHHENKPSQGVVRTSSQRVRGSTNITAQIVSGFRVFSIPKTTNEFVIEQFKAGDAEKLKPFKVELVSKQNPYNPDKTYVSKVEWKGEYFDEEGKAELAEQAVNEFFDENITGMRKEVLEYCAGCGASQRTVETVLRDMVDEKKIEKIRDGKEIKYIVITKKISDNNEKMEEKQLTF